MMDSSREEQLEDMILRLIGEDEDRDAYLRPAEFTLVKEARRLIGRTNEDRSPDFGPEGILTVEGVAVVESTPAPAPAPSSAPPKAPQPSVRPPPPSAPPVEDAAPYEAPAPAPPARPLEELLHFTFRVTAGMAGRYRLVDQVRNVCRVHRIRTNVTEEGFGRFADIRIGNTVALYDGADFIQPDLVDFRDGKAFGSDILQPYDLNVNVEIDYTGKVPDGAAFGAPMEIEVWFEGRIRHARPAPSVRPVRQ